MVVRPHFQRLAERARLRPPVPAGFVYACDREWLQLALSAAFAGFIEPTLIGPESRIRETAEGAGLDISRFTIVKTGDSTREAAACAIDLARSDTVRVLVRGSLANEDLLAPVVATGSGLRGDRRLSHAYYLDLPGVRHGIIVTDGVLNISPTLGAKKEIVQNAIDLAHAIGVFEPNVAILAGIASINHAFPSTLDADALKMMGSEGVFEHAHVDGPMTPDVALQPDAAKSHRLGTEVPGKADVLVGPSMEPTSMLVRAMTAVTGGLAAGLVLGAKVPIVLPTRIESMEVRMASCVLAMLYANRGTVHPADAEARHDARADSVPAS